MTKGFTEQGVDAMPQEPEDAEFLPVGPAVICADERSLRHYEAMETAEQFPAVIYEAERWEGR